MTYQAKAIEWALWSESPPPFHRASRARGRKRQGIRYEASVQAMLREKLGESYRANPWLQFKDSEGVHWCQPDGLFILPDRVLIIEVKYNHTVEAWRQLRLLYEPVVGFLLKRPVAVLEVVKWYDCAVAFPEAIKLVKEVEGHSGSAFGVHIYRA